MTMTDEEILSAAAKLRAARRRRVAKRCEVCGTPFEGIAQRRYCSDACRVRASRARHGGRATAVRKEASLPPRGENESILAYLDRTNDDLMGDRGLTDSSVELVRERAEWERKEATMHNRIPADHAIGASADQPPESSEARRFGAAAEPPRGDDESLVAYLGRIRDANMRAGAFSEDMTEVVRRERDALTEDIRRRMGR